jgi:hypothetical protein
MTTYALAHIKGNEIRQLTAGFHDRAKLVQWWRGCRERCDGGKVQIVEVEKILRAKEMK